MFWWMCITAKEMREFEVKCYKWGVEIFVFCHYNHTLLFCGSLWMSLRTFADYIAKLVNCHSRHIFDVLAVLLQYHDDINTVCGIFVMWWWHWNSTTNTSMICLKWHLFRIVKDSTNIHNAIKLLPETYVWHDVGHVAAAYWNGLWSVTVASMPACWCFPSYFPRVPGRESICDLIRWPDFIVSRVSLY